jgi:hypothetical protein
LSKIGRLLFTIASNSRLSISITLCCASTITCTSMDCCTSTSTTFSSPTSVYPVYASTKLYSTTSSSSNSSMNIGSIDVALGPIYFLARQLLLLMRKNSTIDVQVLYVTWIIICANYIFSLYAFPFTHSEDDDECSGDLTDNGWIFNTPSFFVIPNYSYTFVLLNNSTSSSYLRLCSLLCVSFSFVILYNFSIALFAFMLLRTLELWKRTQLPTTNTNYFR